ncbi:MAG: nickel pincer cofactor biosynthesis protein LarB [Chloroflexi bacterium]|nr:nickel pincer cofactor biosynthesis protein LarB [Chloroflexota bacterium]MDE2862985.1 nickel pincer cofactor biosynthesis protein LarB [Chloroflexota bacterium]MXW28140.1 nickel pincer cofactor biosynthesis protein LarB [Chloroflexota bacterium]MXX66403.1 nickel pincer cofactor biosynthesis protein LarB [Chloroflexota bacterium]MXX99925.1 nickel pincer cofactor biosynthesis protein LarB [Chloroflexota bacterium]
MNTGLRQLLERLADGQVSVQEALSALGDTYTDLGYAKVDDRRSQRTGFPEAIFCPGKTPEQVARIGATLHGAGEVVIATRADDDHAAALMAAVPGSRHIQEARLVIAGRAPGLTGLVAVVTGGTSDIGVATEAAEVATALGAEVERYWDVGVAGIHRLLANRERLERADVIVAVAGMEGALPGVVAGLTDAPVLALPTSVGYGASLGGIAPLLTMLNSCAPGVAVVNIDNGFGAGYLAALLLRGRDRRQ